MKVKINVDRADIKDLIHILKSYTKYLPFKCQLFIRRLADIGIKTIDAKYVSGLGDSSKDHTCEFQLDEEGNVVRGMITVEGKDILFIEFGAGIYFNNGNTHPKAHELGYGVGTYPGQKHAYDPNGWYYRDKDNKDTLRHSLGTEATMPLYNASLEMIANIEQIAQEVFRG